MERAQAHDRSQCAARSDGAHQETRGRDCRGRSADGLDHQRLRRPAPTTPGFCSVYHQQEEQYLAQYGHPSTTDGLADLAGLIGAVSDWVPIFEKLDQAAPPSIEPDVQNVLDSLKQEEQAAEQEVSNPLAGLASGLDAAMMSSASWQNLNTFIAQNCGAS